MTLEQLVIFVAVAEREHLTRGAEALRLTPSAVSSAIKTLEDRYGVPLFDRVGRRIELTRAGRSFLPEARQILASAKNAEAFLGNLGGLRTGTLDIEASQTIANYWLPTRLLRFSTRYPGVSVDFRVGNTASVAQAVMSGRAELGFVEGSVDDAALIGKIMHVDGLVIVISAKSGVASADITPDRLSSFNWIMRERGSGTRAEFETAVEKIGIDIAALPIVATLPTNEAVLSAVRDSGCATALSELVVAPLVASGELIRSDITLMTRQFTMLRHKERKPSAAAVEFETLIRD